MRHHFGLAQAAVLLLPALASAAAVQKPDPNKLPVTQVRDLHYGDVLFQLYQGEDFEAITRLNAYEQWGRIPHHENEAQLLLGGLYLALGLHNEAGARFEKLLTQDVPPAVRNRAWFYLGKVWNARGYHDKAENALRQVQGTLPGELEAEKQLLLANVLMRQNRFEDAAQLLQSWQGPPGWTAFARFNLGVALVRQGRLEEADAHLSAVGTLGEKDGQPLPRRNRAELLSLKDRANLALGFAYLQNQQPEKARPVLERVRLNGPYSSKALLGTGWADAATGDYEKALTPWLALRERNLLDAAVQESYLAVPYAFSQLNAQAQAAEHYESAVRSMDEEGARIDQSIERIRSGNLLEALLIQENKDAQKAQTASSTQKVARNTQAPRQGWFWQLQELPDAPESRYLYTLLADHDFQEGLKNYRDLEWLGSTLTRWSDSLEAFDHMIDARAQAYAARLPRADALLASEPVRRMQGVQQTLTSRLNEAERSADVAALGTPTEQAQWARIQALEGALAAAPANEETAAQRDRLRLVKGVLYFRMNSAFKERSWQQQRALRELEVGLREAQNRWIRLERARSTAPSDTQVFSTRLADLRERIRATQTRMADLAAKQNEHLEQLAIAHLQAQKERLQAYQVQARFALASIYDRAASEEGGGSTPASEPVAPQSVEPAP